MKFKFLIMIIATFFVVSCQSHSDVTYVSDDLGLEIIYPENWRFQHTTSAIHIQTQAKSLIHIQKIEDTSPEVEWAKLLDSQLGQKITVNNSSDIILGNFAGISRVVYHEEFTTQRTDTIGQQHTTTQAIVIEYIWLQVSDDVLFISIANPDNQTTKFIQSIKFLDS